MQKESQAFLGSSNFSYKVHLDLQKGETSPDRRHAGELYSEKHVRLPGRYIPHVHVLRVFRVSTELHPFVRHDAVLGARGDSRIGIGILTTREVTMHRNKIFYCWKIL